MFVRTYKYQEMILRFPRKFVRLYLKSTMKHNSTLFLPFPILDKSCDKTFPRLGVRPLPTIYHLFFHGGKGTVPPQFVKKKVTPQIKFSQTWDFVRRACLSVYVIPEPRKRKGLRAVNWYIPRICAKMHEAKER